MRQSFWGKDRYLDKPPTETDRKLAMTKILMRSFDKKSRSFIFFCGDVRVCQTGFLILIGISTRESRPPKHWLRTVKDIQSDEYDSTTYLSNYTNKNIAQSKASIQRDKTFKRLNDKRSSKFQHATNYILYIAQIFADTCPTNKDIRAVPYESVNQLFEEYCNHCESTKVNINCQAKRGTFFKAFNELGSQIKLVGAKGMLLLILSLLDSFNNNKII